jgi:hypothetical protein
MMAGGHDRRTTDASANGIIAIPDNGAAPSQKLAGLVAELAEALKAVPDSDDDAADRAVAVRRSSRNILDDEDDEDSNMPIPSTWRETPKTAEAGTLSEQLRAAVLGFGTGLAIVVPVVLLLTGRLGDLPISSYLPDLRAQISAFVPVEEASAPASDDTIRQRSVSTSVQQPAKPLVVAAAQETVRPAQAVSAAEKPKSNPWSEALADGERLIGRGDIRSAREVLSRPAAADDPGAILALGETFDPNMLAAWGVRDVAPDVAVAKALYAKALLAGMDRARTRLEALN